MAKCTPRGVNSSSSSSVESKWIQLESKESTPIAFTSFLTASENSRRDFRLTL
ncbi:unnamed protein product [Schistosoma margrebowiei]|uniref:Uncharacterized protein n=1 Tax=Schistosoma margrebowiei TaxID=48269 RepID=A0A3P8E0B8_9TREM|nr:unnamed protein product [Schistosoma margrebowiei]